MAEPAISTEPKNTETFLLSILTSTWERRLQHAAVRDHGTKPVLMTGRVPAVPQSPAPRWY
jgi:hypothetical protein